MKKIILICLIAVSLLLAACGPSTDKGVNPFIGGKEATTMKFMTGAPPTSIFDKSGTTFSIVTQLDNIGESTIKKNEGYVDIVGINPSDFGATTLKKVLPDDLQGKKKNFEGTPIDGGRTTIGFEGLKYIPEVQGSIQLPIRARFCFNYQTKTSTLICVKKSLIEETNKKEICTLEGEKNPQNSGAPIQITSMIENPIGNGKVQLLFKIEHVGTGDGFFKKTLSECNDVVTNSDRGKIWVEVNSISNGRIVPTCTGLSEMSGTNKGYATLYQDSAGKYAPTQVSCTIDANTATTVFQTPISITLDYKYLQHLETSLEIRHVTG